MSSPKYKESDTVTLESAKTFLIPWTPVEPTGKQGAGRKWVREDGSEVSNDEWKILHEQITNASDPRYSLKDRDEICAIYGTKWQTLQKKFRGKNESNSTRVNGRGQPLPPLAPLELKYGAKSKKFANPQTPNQKVGFLQERIESAEAHLVKLKADLEIAKAEGIAELEAQLEALRQL